MRDPKEYKKIEVPKEGGVPGNLLEFDEFEEGHDSLVGKENSETTSDEIFEDFDFSEALEENTDKEEEDEVYYQDEEEESQEQEEKEQKEKDAPADKKQEEEAEKKRKRDSVSRIQELAKFNKELSQKNQQLEAKINALLTDKEKTTLDSQKTLKSTLEAQAENLQKQLTNAIEEGDASETVRLQDELLTSKMNIQKVGQDIEERETYQKEKQQQAQTAQAQSQVPQKAWDWIDAHPLFGTDSVFQTTAIAVNDSLINEGYNPETDRFYEELDARLKPRFPEAFDNGGGDSVQLDTEDTDQESTSTEQTQKGSKKDSQQKQKQQYQETVSRANSRSVGKNTPKNVGKKGVPVTAEEAKLAKRWGMSLKDFAKQKHHIETSKDDDGYSPIFINKN